MLQLAYKRIYSTWTTASSIIMKRALIYRSPLLIKSVARAISIFALCLVLGIQPAWCRNVFFESANSNPNLHSKLKPYCIDARKRVEEIWLQADPHSGGEIQLIFTVDQSGELLNVFPRTLEDSPLRERATYSIVECKNLPPLPEGQGTLVVLATFKSKPVVVKRDMSPETKHFIKDAVIVSSLIGLTGLAIYGLLKLNQNGSGGYIANGATNPNFHYVGPYTDHFGNYHPGKWQSNPNGTMMDNFSSKGNINPFTGQPGYVYSQY